MLLCLVIGLAVAIERILYLTLSTINKRKSIAKSRGGAEHGGVEAAGGLPHARPDRLSDLLAGSRSLDQGSGSDSVEKASRFLRFGAEGPDGVGSWIGLFIALSPMLGFMGRSWTLIGAFDAIQAAYDIV